MLEQVGDRLFSLVCLDRYSRSSVFRNDSIVFIFQIWRSNKKSSAMIDISITGLFGLGCSSDSAQCEERQMEEVQIIGKPKMDQVIGILKLTTHFLII
jgi:hypothetical protein